MSILIIGGGNMGKTYAQSFINSKLIAREELFIYDKDKLKIDLINQFQLGQGVQELGEFVKNIDTIILAVKPQDTKNLFPELKPFLRPDQLFLTIMAGVKIADIQSQLGIEKVVRAMPNLPAQIGMGMTVFCSSDKVPKKDLTYIQNLLETTGHSIIVEKEDMLNGATAISGSGPAYVFYFLDAMINSALEMGFSPSEAHLLVEQTFLGSVNLIKRNNLNCNQWIEKVASRGGTTEAALKVFDENKVKDGIKKGLETALNRARELSEE